MLGVYAHRPDPALLGVKSFPVADTWTNKALHFASDYAAKSALWLIRLPL